MPKTEQTSSGPLVTLAEGESLDLSQGSDFDPGLVGDRARTDPESALVDTSGEPVIKTEGDQTKAGHVSEVDRPNEVLPTAGELRKAGYVVADSYKDNEVPSSYEADTPAGPGEVRLVRDTTAEAEVPKTTKAVAKAPKNK